MTSKQRAYLKGLAMNIDPAFQIGKSSLTPEFTEAIAECFNTRELVKIAVLKNCFDDPKEIAQVLAERTQFLHKQKIINLFLFIFNFKQHRKFVSSYCAFIFAGICSISCRYRRCYYCFYNNNCCP